jgi:hypothetical protein
MANWSKRININERRTCWLHSKWAVLLKEAERRILNVCFYQYTRDRAVGASQDH